MLQADPSRRAEARAERPADLLTATIGDAAIRMKTASVRRRIGELRIEQAQLEAALAALETELPALVNVAQSGPFEGATVTNKSPSWAKVTLFRRLFKGRPDAFPLRETANRRARAIRRPAPTNEPAVSAPSRR